MICTVVINTTLDTDELFCPVQVIIVPSKSLLTFSMVMVDTNGSAIGEESLENVMLVVFTLIGVITGLWSDEEILLISCSESWLVVLTLHTKKMWFVLETRVYCPPGQNNIIPPDM